MTYSELLLLVEEMNSAFASYLDAIDWAQRAHHNYEEWGPAEYDPIDAAENKFHDAYLKIKRIDEKYTDANEKCAELANDMRNERDTAIELLSNLEPFVHEYLENNPNEKELLDRLKNTK